MHERAHTTREVIKDSCWLTTTKKKHSAQYKFQMDQNITNFLKTNNPGKKFFSIYI